MTIPREYFQPSQYLIVSTIIGAICALIVMSKNNKQLLKGTSNNIFPFALTVLLIYYIGRRPITYFADTWLYTMMFNMVQSGEWSNIPSYEPFWTWFHGIFVDLGSASDWLLGIATLYIGGMALATYRWLPRHFFIGLVFCITSFSFYAFATNGIRSGMASSIAMVAISLVDTKRRDFVATIIAIALLYLAIMTHSSMIIPAGAALVSYFMRSTKYSFKIWISCLILGLLFNSSFQGLFSWLSEDDRMASYSMLQQSAQYIKMYFRWDFVAYSALPILLGYYATNKKKIVDGKYIFLLNTYIIANAFWLLICEIAYSNRFAYLSWFLYPIVVAYPLCKFEIFKNQGPLLGLILVGLMILTIVL